MINRTASLKGSEDRFARTDINNPSRSFGTLWHLECVLVGLSFLSWKFSMCLRLGCSTWVIEDFWFVRFLWCCIKPCWSCPDPCACWHSALISSLSLYLSFFLSLFFSLSSSPSVHYFASVRFKHHKGEEKRFLVQFYLTWLITFVTKRPKSINPFRLMYMLFVSLQSTFFDEPFLNFWQQGHFILHDVIVWFILNAQSKGLCVDAMC